MPRGWILKERPQGALTPECFALETRPDIPLDKGMVRVRNLWISVDPYMRGLLDGEGGYMPAIPLGDPMHGHAIGEVVESRSATLPAGTRVVHNEGWRDGGVLAAGDCTPIEPSDVPLEHFLGSFGMPGMTAYFGLLHGAEAEPGQTLFVSSAAGAVGSTVVQIGKAIGLRVIGSAGGAEKCARVLDLGADAVIDYKAPNNLSEKLAQSAPDGIDVYFDNVGGDHLAAAIDNARMGMRVTLCGMIAGYGGKAEMRIENPMRLVARRIRLQGFIAPDYYHLRPKFIEDMEGWFKSGALTCPTTIHEGLENVPAAFCSLFRDGGVGKVLVRLA